MYSTFDCKINLFIDEQILIFLTVKQNITTILSHNLQSIPYIFLIPVIPHYHLLFLQLGKHTI